MSTSIDSADHAVEPVDLNDPATFAAGIPHAAFAEMRANEGLTWSPAGRGSERGFWSVTRQADLVEVSRDPETYSSAVGHIQIYDIDEDALDARASMIDMDPPIHTRLRRIVSSAFTPRHVQSYRGAVRARAEAALDGLEAAGGGDWVTAVAKPIPIGVICDIMGVPEEDHAFMVELSDHLVAGTASEPLEPTAYGNTTDLRLLPFNSPAASAMSAYATQLAERRRAEPADDLVTQLIEAEIDGERLSDEEFANFFRLMIFAGNETTRSSMAHLALHWQRFALGHRGRRRRPLEGVDDGGGGHSLFLADPLFPPHRDPSDDTVGNVARRSGTRSSCGTPQRTSTTASIPTR